MLLESGFLNNPVVFCSEVCRKQQSAVGCTVLLLSSV